ncbi:MAG: hypothetical protein AAFU79_25460, partial [Myxococcota bacterium]
MRRVDIQDLAEAGHGPHREAVLRIEIGLAHQLGDRLSLGYPIGKVEDLGRGLLFTPRARRQLGDGEALVRARGRNAAERPRQLAVGIEGPLELPPVRPWRPLDELPPEERSAPSPAFTRGAIRSLLTWLGSPRRDRAVVNARAMPAEWVPAKTVVTVCGDGFAETRPTRLGVLLRLAVLGARSLVLAARAAVVPPTAPLPEPVRRDEVASLSVVLLTQPARLER